jgi:predicted nucleotidyltransferase/HEPN domain-containing protein
MVDPHDSSVVTPASDQVALAQAVERLVEALAPERIYLFGSQARGDATADSDYDVLVIVPSSDQPGYRRAQTAYHALRGVRLPVEVVVFTRAEFDYQLPARASLPATVAREGKVLYAARDDLRVDLTCQWLVKAGRELQAPHLAIDLPDIAVFHCRQAMEKALKGYLTWQDEPFRRTTALSELLEQCQFFDAGFQCMSKAAKLLTPYATDFRDPGVDKDPTTEEAEQARRLAQHAYDFVLARLPAEVTDRL